MASDSASSSNADDRFIAIEAEDKSSVASSDEGAGVESSAWVDVSTRAVSVSANDDSSDSAVVSFDPRCRLSSIASVAAGFPGSVASKLLSASSSTSFVISSARSSALWLPEQKHAPTNSTHQRKLQFCGNVLYIDLERKKARKQAYCTVHLPRCTGLS
jgi:hypothetical protein